MEHMFKVALVDREEIHRVLLAEHVQRQRHPAEEEPRRGRRCPSAPAAFEEAAVVQQSHDLAGEAVCLVRQVWSRPSFQHQGLDSREAELAGQEKAGGSTADDDDVEHH